MQLLLAAVFSTLIGGPFHHPPQSMPDSSYLTFTLEKGIITARIFRWSKQATTAAALNRFIDDHLSAINPKKIIIFGDPNAKYPEFKPIIEAMKKHDWIKFKFQPTNPKQKTPLAPPQKEIAFID